MKVRADRCESVCIDKVIEAEDQVSDGVETGES